MWLDRHRELRSLMASWRFLHRWLALLMLAVILCHIVVAFKFGDLWILRGGR
jgi:cytochrome b561